MNPLPATSGPLVPRKRQPRPRMRRGEGRLSTHSGRSSRVGSVARADQRSTFRCWTSGSGAKLPLFP